MAQAAAEFMTLAEVSIREAKQADVPGILEIYNEAVLNTTATADYEPSTLKQRTEWFEQRKKLQLPIFVAVSDHGKIVGWSSLSAYHSRHGYRFTAEVSVYVDAEMRGQGVGKMLMPPLIEAAKTRGLHALIASIDSQNAASIRLHESFGFVMKGRLDQIITKFGRWLDVVYLELILEEGAS
jgi:L-amino acid N-acyltransferase YncA